MNKEEVAVRKAINVVGRVVRTLSLASSPEQARVCMEEGSNELHEIADELEGDRFDGSPVLVEYEVPEGILDGLSQIAKEISQHSPSGKVYPELPIKIRELARQMDCLSRGQNRNHRRLNQPVLTGH
jgi:hypothetical protein